MWVQLKEDLGAGETIKVKSQVPSQHPHGGSQPSITPGQKICCPLLTSRDTRHAHDAHMQTKHSYTKKK